MPLRLYNTLTRRKEDFAPIDPANVRLYACGPTVYDHLHIGNGRMLIVFDVLFRLLRHEFGAEHVTYVRNITDVDDKINARAAERGVDIRVLTDEMTAIFHEDARALGCLPPTVEPRATDHIAQMIAMIEKLIANGHAYVADGHVLFDVPSMPAYGKLSKRPLDEMIAGARVEVAPYKRGPMDFVLWKPSRPDEPGWDSPWGRGRPGWHIECSAMSSEYLGETFDIHGGGIDLVFPHHENEIAQSCCAFGHDIMANVWMHNGHLQVEGEKMSKSRGNFVTIHELLHTEKFGGRKWPGEVLRLAMLQTHYAQPMDWTVKKLHDSERELKNWAAILAPWYDEQLRSSSLSIESKVRPAISGIEPSQALLKELSNDLNTSGAITILRQHFSKVQEADEDTKGKLLIDSEFLGILSRKRLRFLAPKVYALKADDLVTAPASIGSPTLRVIVPRQGLSKLEQRIISLITEREAVRKNKNFAESDRIRDELEAMGVTLKDNKDGTTSWEVKQ